MFFSNNLRPQRFLADLVQIELSDTPLGPTQFIVLGGIASAEAFGTAKINEQIRLTGIASAEAFGTAKINEQIRLTGIVSAEAFGTTKVIPVIRLTGIASAEAFGTAKINEQIRLTGIASAEAFGTAKINEQIRTTGIASAEAFGTAKINEQIRTTGIASAEAFGTATVTVASAGNTISPAGIVSAEAFGTTKVIPIVRPTGIASAEAFGASKINEQIRLTGIASAAAFGTPIVGFGKVLYPTGIVSAEAFGTQRVSVGAPLGTRPDAYVRHSVEGQVIKGAFFATIDMAIPISVPGNAAWRGNCLADFVTLVPLPLQTFLVKGLGRFNLFSDLTGRRGTLDMTIKVKVSGTVRTLVCLTDVPEGPSNRILIGLDTQNRPFVQITNSTGVTVAEYTPATASVTSGTTMQLRMSWDSQNPIVGLRYVSLRKNREFVADTDWTVPPLAGWVSFQPTHMLLGSGVLGTSDFNGDIDMIQGTNLTAP